MKKIEDYNMENASIPKLDWIVFIYIHSPRELTYWLLVNENTSGTGQGRTDGVLTNCGANFGVPYKRSIQIVDCFLNISSNAN